MGQQKIITMNLDYIDKEAEEIIEFLSKEKDFYKIKHDLKEYGFLHKKSGINCFVFINNNSNYAIKLSDRHDPIPNSKSIFGKCYAKIFYISKNRKIRIQEKLKIKENNETLDIIVKKFKMSEDDLWKFDLHEGNVGYNKDNELKILDYRDYKRKQHRSYHNINTWYGKKIC